jgi:hypothetical protein
MEAIGLNRDAVAELGRGIAGAIAISFTAKNLR